MISPEREEELNAIANEIFEALSCERYEPSERGAGWAPTDKGCDAVIHILSRAKAIMWDRDSPAERREAALLELKRQQNKAKVVAERLLGNTAIIRGECIHCGQWIMREKGNIRWRNSISDDTCPIRKIRGDRFWSHADKDDNKRFSPGATM